MARSGIQAFIAFVFFCGAVSAQTNKTLIQMQVDDGSGAALPKARIEFNPLASASSGMSAETDNEGKAGLNLPAGRYQVLVSSQSFCPHRWNVEIPNLQRVRFAFDLRVGPCHVSTVEVIGAPETGQPESPGPASETTLQEVVVTDGAGALVANAIVQARCPDSRLATETIADAAGKALVAVGTGDCTVAVLATGFNAWSAKINSREMRRTVTAVLSIANQCAGCLTVGPAEELEFEHFVPEGSIPAIPMESLALSAQKRRVARRRADL